MYISEETLIDKLRGIISFMVADANETNAQRICFNLTTHGIGEREMKEQLGLSFQYDKLIKLGAEFDPYYDWDYDLDGPDPSGYTPYPQDLEYE